MNFDFRQYLAEGYDADEKSDVITDFGKYLETELGLTLDPETRKYSNGPLWFAIGTGNGKYRDRRITVGTNSSKLKSDEEWTTLNFMVSDMGELVAYLDAEDHGLLYNTPAFKKDAAGKKKTKTRRAGKKAAAKAEEAVVEEAPAAESAE
jgi:hypothetical protein